MKGIKISSRYAKSLLQLALEKNQLDAVYADMKLIDETIDSSRELSNLLNNPVVKTDTKVSILNQLFGGHIGQITHGFMKLLTEKGREGYLAEVAQSFVEQVKTYKHITSAEVTTAIRMDNRTREHVLRIAKELKGGTIDLVERVDNELIGGFVLKVGDNMIDTSIAGQLRGLRREFDDNPYVPDF
ncbi:MAG: ATP synthase F1 subunit delta [Flavobacteriales bacterium]